MHVISDGGLSIALAFHLNSRTDIMCMCVFMCIPLDSFSISLVAVLPVATARRVS